MFFFYHILTTALYPVLAFIIYIRRLIGKEDPNRFKEKIFYTPARTDQLKLIWFHGASIGEINTIIPIIKYILKNNSKIKILITSVTLSSSEIIRSEFENETNVIHKYFPIDVSFLIKRFLNNWKPKSIVFIDSEIWPNFIFEIKKRDIPLILLNARITKKTYRRWKFFEGFSKTIFSSFDKCIAASKDSENNLLNLGASNVKYFGNLKYIPNSDKTENLHIDLEKEFQGKKAWLAVSTHKNEEEFCVKTHIKVLEAYKNSLMIIIPRHINRIKKIYSKIKEFNLNVQIIDKNESLKKDTQVILINSFGNLERYYNYCKSVFIGKSLVKELILVGGQNPIEAARQSCRIYHGPYVYNFQEVYDFLDKNNIAEEINDYNSLGQKVMEDFKTIKIFDEKKIKKINLFGEDIFKKTINELEALFND